jgi:L-2-hydroxyglutarate oxidase LhgO
MIYSTDFLVIGGGVIGINVARALKCTFPDSKVTLIEKEHECGLHASGRNSGVLHAGFYYTSDSLKARFTRTGNKMMTDYCQEKKLRINKNGKLVVARNRQEHESLQVLLERGKANKVEIEEISEEEARKIEPRVKTCEKALFAPSTATVDPFEVVQSMKQDAKNDGVLIQSGVAFLRKENNDIMTSRGVFVAGYVVNCAGLYADKIALQFGFSEKYRILPFKGLYLYSEEPAGAIRTNIYPVPDLKNPFLGVHFTITVDGKIKIGPTAIPAFWREQYGLIKNFNIEEMYDILKRQVGLLKSSDFDFRSLAIEEIKKYSRRRMVYLASELVEGISEKYYMKWGKPGIRAQLFDIQKNRLEMDFVIEGDHKSLHVLNAVSPAFTCSIPFSQYVVDEVRSQLQ